VPKREMADSAGRDLMPYALCLMPYALCLMPCLMPYALCLMPYCLAPAEASRMRATRRPHTPTFLHQHAVKTLYTLDDAGTNRYIPGKSRDYASCDPALAGRT
jgi:hypothetical protein